MKINYIDRRTGEKRAEKVYKDPFLSFLHNSAFGNWINQKISRQPWFSYFIGWWQKQFFTKRKIAPFIKDFDIDTADFEKPTDGYKSFNDFFTRRLKPNARPLAQENDKAIIPADGRYLFYPKIDEADGFVIKGQKFSLPNLLQNDLMAEKYATGSMVIARLSPLDYHRYHFPCDCVPGPARLINGFLFSVNPISIKNNIELFTENKRMITELKTKQFGCIQYIEIGATCVGTIHQTYTPGSSYKKGDEKGYFSFGGSSLILLFEPGAIVFDNDLLSHSSEHIEILCLMGQSLGRASSFKNN